MKEEPVEVEEIKAEELEAALQRAKAVMCEEDYNQLSKVVKAYIYLTGLLENKSTTLARLRKIIWGATSEKTDVVFKDQPQDTTAEPLVKGEDGSPAKKRKGHGRNGVEAYLGAEKIPVSHPTLQPGTCCPDCQKGKVYDFANPSPLVRVMGQAPLKAIVYQLKKLRCNACGHVFQASPPDGVGYAKYDETVASMIALLKYGSGFPFHRLEKLEGYLGVPMPSGTQWELVAGAGQMLEPAYRELIRQAAQGEVLHNDDTGMTILELFGKKREGSKEESPERTGTFTSGFISVHEDKHMALFFTGHRHAGENMEELLKQRASELGPPIQMCDALSRNLPDELSTIVANCLVHARRQFADVAGSFPEECRHMLEALKCIYINDAETKRRGMSAQERLTFHQAQSGEIMKDLKKWAHDLLEHKKVEPNSGLGAALQYLLRHWDKLTLFLSRAGAPLDNNICERGLKKAILHRKSALFYKTKNGAQVGDMFMSLIHTAELAKANPFDYLTELQRHCKDVANSPQDWMPWNYRDTLNRMPTSLPAG